MTKRTYTQEQEQKALDLCREMQSAAEAPGASGQCVEGEAVFYYPWERSLIPGHIRSEDGVNEFKISHTCEYHFDRWFGSEDESPELWDEDTKSVVGPILGAK